MAEYGLDNIPETLEAIAQASSKLYAEADGRLELEPEESERLYNEMVHALHSLGIGDVDNYYCLSMG